MKKHWNGKKYIVTPNREIFLPPAQKRNRFLTLVLSIGSTLILLTMV